MEVVTLLYHNISIYHLTKFQKFVYNLSLTINNIIDSTYKTFATVIFEQLFILIYIYNVYIILYLTETISNKQPNNFAFEKIAT